MTHAGGDSPTRRQVLGLGLDGHGLGPQSADGMTRLTHGDDYVLVGGSEHAHRTMQAFVEHLVDACRSEGTTLGEAPPELLEEILTELAEDEDEPRPPRRG